MATGLDEETIAVTKPKSEFQNDYPIPIDDILKSIKSGAKAYIVFSKFDETVLEMKFKFAKSGKAYINRDEDNITEIDFKNVLFEFEQPLTINGIEHTKLKLNGSFKTSYKN